MAQKILNEYIIECHTDRPLRHQSQPYWVDLWTDLRHSILDSYTVVERGCNTMSLPYPRAERRLNEYSIECYTARPLRHQSQTYWVDVWTDLRYSNLGSCTVVEQECNTVRLPYSMAQRILNEHITEFYTYRPLPATHYLPGGFMTCPELL